MSGGEFTLTYPNRRPDGGNICIGQSGSAIEATGETGMRLTVLSNHVGRVVCIGAKK
jgi:hypothetical protein